MFALNSRHGYVWELEFWFHPPHLFRLCDCIFTRNSRLIYLTKYLKYTGNSSLLAFFNENLFMTHRGISFLIVIIDRRLKRFM